MQTEENIKLVEKFLRGEASVDEVHYLLVLLKDPDVIDQYMYSAWSQATYDQDPERSERIFRTISNHITKGHRYRIPGITRWVACAVFFLVFGLLSLFIYFPRTAFDDVKLYVENGQKASLTLPDGSSVKLNSGSSVTYGRNFGKSKRVVELKGEAFFDVSPRKNCPFIVKCDNGLLVEALGTSFNVKAYDDEKSIEVMLTTGEVKVSTAIDIFYLEPGELLEYFKPENYTRKSNIKDASVYLSWKNNELIFEDESIENIISHLTRHYNAAFVFQDDKIKEYRFSGTLPNHSLLSVLDVFSLSAPIAYTIKNGIIYLSENEYTREYFDEITSINSKN